MELNVLYISYDGVTDPLGQSQILPYLRGLARKDRKFILLSFEKKKRIANKEQVRKLRFELGQNNIQWKVLMYHKRPPLISSLYDILRGIIVSWYLAKKKRIEIVHARSYVPALIALFLKKKWGVKFIFDMRGLWPEERVEGNLWKKDGLVYRITKFFEKKFLLNADEIIVLTEKSRRIISALPYLQKKDIKVSTIPTCVDLDKFQVYSSQECFLTKLKDRFIIVYLGSIGTWYMLEEMIGFFKFLKLKKKNAFFLFLSPGEKLLIETQLQRANVPEDSFHIREVSHNDVPMWLSHANVSIFFIRPTYSKKGSCPTKFAESLACGLPLIINSGIGDCDEYINREKVGVLVKEFSTDGYSHAIDDLLRLLNNNNLSLQCRDTASKYFSLNEGIERYNQIYRNLIN